eukprot:22588_1
MTGIFLKHKQSEIKDIESYEAIEYTIRPSNELIAWDKLTRQQPKEPIKDVQKMIQSLQKAMKIFVDTFQTIPSYINQPIKHSINKNINGYELPYPGCSKQNGVIYYIHGGAFIGGHVENGYPMLCIMMQYLGYTSFSIDYRICPQYTITDSVMDVINGYKYIINTLKVPSERIIFIGESAGATLTLLALQQLNDNKHKYNLELPLCGVLLSVLTDLGLDSLHSITTNAKTDCMSNVYALRECCKMVLDKDDSDIKHPKYSPLYGNWTGLCALYFSSGATEILFSDGEQAYRKCKENDVEVECEWNPVLPHGVGAWCSWLPESRDSVIRFIQWIKYIQKKGNVVKNESFD